MPDDTGQSFHVLSFWAVCADAPPPPLFFKLVLLQVRFKECVFVCNLRCTYLYLSLLEMWFANTFSQSVASLFVLMSFEKQSFQFFYIVQFVNFFLLWILLLVLCLRNLCLIQGHKDFLLEVLVLGFTFLGLWSVVSWFLYVVWALYPLACECAALPARLLKTLLLHCTAFVPSWESCIPVCVGFSLGRMSVLNLFCLFWCHCCSVWMVLAFIVHLRVVAKSPALFWLFQMLGISLWILESTFCSFRRSYWYFYWDYIKSINQFGEYWHFNSIGFSNSWT